MKCNLFLIFLFFAFTSISQNKIEPKFITHLTDNNLKSEHLTYLNTFPKSDTTHYYLAKYYVTYTNLDSFFIHFNSSKYLFLNDTNSSQKISLLLYKNSEDSLLDEWFENKFNDQLNSKLKEIYFSCKIPSINDTTFFPLKLRTAYLKYCKVQKKKPLLAATLSLIPGLGELYIGNGNKAFLKLVMNSAFAFQTIESLKKAPDALILNGINLGFFTTFYIVNIYGAYIDTKVKKTELKKQLLIDVSNYYSHNTL